MFSDDEFPFRLLELFIELFLHLKDLKKTFKINKFFHETTFVINILTM